VFTLSLPLPPAVPTTDAPPAPARHAGPRLTGLRVLAAEDTEINRFCLQDLLTQEHARVSFAHDGRQALELVRQQGAAAFDIVLMDVQMPVMDGYEAASRLRVLAPGLPVIGLTAHAMSEERARCLAAGMVDHVVKPIDSDNLVGAILRQLRPADAGEPSLAASAPAVPAADSGESIDWAGLEARYRGQPGFVDKLASSVLAHDRATPGQLRAAVAAQDWERLAFLAHDLKGTGGNMMAQPLYELARQTEDAVRGNTAALPTELEGLVEQLAVALERLLAAMETRLRGRAGQA
jgi:CheY-like chemotaxis protein